MKSIYICPLLLFCVPAMACNCYLQHELECFMRSDFVVKAKIVKGYQDNREEGIYSISDYWIQIEPLERYKGVSPDTLKVMGGSMCTLILRENTTWLIYAKLYEGNFVIDYCSGSFQIDKYKFYRNPPKQLQAKHKQKVDKKLQILEVLKMNNINYTYRHEFKVVLEDLYEKLKVFDGIILNDKFAIFEISFNDKGKVYDLKMLDGFNNTIDDELSELILHLDFSLRNKNEIDFPFKWLIGIYYYEREEEYPSFLSPVLL